MKKPTNREGWARPLQARKFHYFALDGRALCGHWLLFPIRVDDGDPTVLTPDSCRACHRELFRLETAQACRAAKLNSK